ncbi:MAG: TonB-dependent receptor [Pseudomonadota bacterium]
MKSLIMSAVCAAALIAPNAYAQSSESSDRDDEDDVAVLDTVTVQSRRIEENLQDVPISISVVGAEEFLEKALFEFGDIGDITPGLVIDGPSAASNFVSIRGVGGLGTGSPVSPAVSVFLDNAAAPDAALLINSTLDMERVEVLRGPQGTLYGSNATAGAINLYTRSPQLDGFSNAILEATYSVYDHNGNNSYELEGATDITFVEGVFGVRLAGSIRRDEGYINNPFVGDSVNQIDQDNVRAKIAYDSGGSFTADLTLGLFEGENQEVFLIDTPSETGQGGLPVPAAFQTLDLFDFKTSQVPEKNPETIQYNILNMNWDTALGAVTSVTSYFDQSVRLTRDQDNLGAFDDVVIFAVEREAFTQELRLAGDTYDGRLSYLVGGYYSNNERDISSLFDLTSTGVIPVVLDDNAGKDTSEVFALFSNNTLDITDRLSVSAGVRVEKSSRDVVDPFIDTNATVLSLALGGPQVTGIFEGGFDETNTAWSLKTTYEVSDALTVFAGLDNAFRAGGFNNIAAGAFQNGGFRDFGTENTTAVEAGFKSNGWLHERLKLNASVYFQSFEDFQFQTFSPQSFSDITNSLAAATEAGFALPPGTLQALGYPSNDGLFLSLPSIGLVVSAPEAENKGVELEFDFQASDHWSFGGSLSTNDFEFTDFDNVPTSPQLADPVITPDTILSTFGLGTVYAGANAQAALDALGALQGLPPGALQVTGDTVSAATIPFEDLTGLNTSFTPLAYTLTGQYQSDPDLIWNSQAFVRGVYAFTQFDSDTSPTIIGDYGTLDLFAGLINEEAGITVQLFATNVLNEEYVLGVAADIDTPLGPRALPQPPRQIGLTLRKSF